MKKLLPYLAALAVVTVVTFASAYTGEIDISTNKAINMANNTQLGVTNMPVWSNAAMNYDTSIIFNTTFSSSTVNTEMTEIQGRGINYIRLDGGYTSTSTQGTFTWVQNAATIAHTYGINTMCFPQGPSTLTSATEARWINAVVADAASVQGLCDEFEVGNEQVPAHDGSLTDAQVLADILTIAQDIKTAGIYTGELGYSTQQDHGTVTEETEWINNGTIAPLDFICINAYNNGDYKNYQFFHDSIQRLQNAYGVANVCVSEWSVTSSWNPNLTDTQMTAGIANEMQILRNLNVERAYYFTYETLFNFNKPLIPTQSNCNQARSGRTTISSRNTRKASSNMWQKLLQHLGYRSRCCGANIMHWAFGNYRCDKWGKRV